MKEQKLIIVSGMYGSGKTTYCNRFNYPLIHNDNIYNYDARIMNYKTIANWKNKNTESEILMMDAYMFGVDKDLSGINKAIYPVINIGVIIVYTTLKELYKCQRSTPERLKRKTVQNLSIKDDVYAMKHDQGELSDIFTDHLDNGRISSVEYIFREGNRYMTKDKEHFFKIIGEGCL